MWVLYQCSKINEVAEYDDHQENGVKQDNNMAPSRYSLGIPSGNQNERQENNLNPAFNPTAIEMPPKPEYEVPNNFPSNIQPNAHGANNHMTPSSNLPYSPREPSGNQNERQENNLNPTFNPTFNPTAIEIPANPEYEARNNFPSNIQPNADGANNHMTPSSNLPYSLGEPNGDQNERQENNFNPSFNPTFNPASIEMQANPEYEARNNFPSSFQTNTYGANNPMTPSSNLPYSLTPGEANGNQNGSEPAYAGGWVNQSYKHSE